LVEDTSKLEEANNRKEVKVIDSKEIKQISEIELRDFVLYCLRYLTFEKVVFDDETAKYTAPHCQHNFSQMLSYVLSPA